MSVIPPTISERTHQRGNSLQAANNTTIPTYGQQSMTLNLGLRRVFPWIFTIADTKYPILGADFLRNVDLLVDIRRTQLVDANTKIEANGFISNVAESTRLTVLNDIASSRYEKIPKDFPSLTNTNSGDTPIKHTVTHRIKTARSPVYARPRRLALPMCADTIVCDTSTGTPRPYVPAQYRRQVFDALHSLSDSDIRSTQKLVTSRYVWLENEHRRAKVGQIV